LLGQIGGERFAGGLVGPGDELMVLFPKGVGETTD
jgi:hypothetical protein